MVCNYLFDFVVIVIALHVKKMDLQQKAEMI